MRQIIIPVILTFVSTCLKKLTTIVLIPVFKYYAPYISG
ncbi:hypothetical protein B6N60_04210 [Richelia sinica FACHB-800]|uniref:Uncharacterized protein n=1 Tax=Richelia sinica FACHB-800 TaxID=1357546 RepID=A0A975TB64_9NOST|nr:hypothetical protein B6N60_04210 [Richelia sinica FACHB-800]